MPEVEGWSGRCFEDFHVGDVYRHRLGRTVLVADNSWFSQLTMNTNPMHVDANYASRTSFGRPLVNSCFTLALVTGLSVADVSQNALANLGWDEVRLPHPVFEGDTLYASSEVVEVGPSRSHPDAGIVTVRTTGFTEDGTVVISFRRTVMVYRRDALPALPSPRTNLAAE